MERRDGCLVLENGMVFPGTRFGARKDVTAEVVFATGMNGYLETLTDKSYYGQAVTQTFPLIGNYGVIPDDFEAEHPALFGYIVSECCEEPSNFRSEGRLSDWLEKEGIPGLRGVDTRTLTRVLRENGTMNGMICSAPEQADLEALKHYRVRGAVAATTVRKPITLGEGNTRARVALLDYGMKSNIARCLVKRGCAVTVLPAQTKADEIKNLAPDGIMLSNGAGDPADNTDLIANLKDIARLGIPIMAICMGHQLLALAHGIPTRKLKFGHRGANQPVLRLSDSHLAITTQNHGYQVAFDPDDSLCAKTAVLTYQNLNDGTCEGLRYLDTPAVSVQFHPEACAGPKDTDYIFDEFMSMMAKGGF